MLYRSAWVSRSMQTIPPDSQTRLCGYSLVLKATNGYTPLSHLLPQNSHTGLVFSCHNFSVTICRKSNRASMSVFPPVWVWCCCWWSNRWHCYWWHQHSVKDMWILTKESYASNASNAFTTIYYYTKHTFDYTSKARYESKNDETFCYCISIS